MRAGKPDPLVRFHSGVKCLRVRLRRAVVRLTFNRVGPLPNVDAELTNVYGFSLVARLAVKDEVLFRCT